MSSCHCWASKGTVQPGAPSFSFLPWSICAHSLCLGLHITSSREVVSSISRLRYMVLMGALINIVMLLSVLFIKWTIPRTFQGIFQTCILRPSDNCPRLSASDRRNLTSLRGWGLKTRELSLWHFPFKRWNWKSKALNWPLHIFGGALVLELFCVLWR